MTAKAMRKALIEQKGLEATYEKGVRLAKKAFRQVANRLQRDEILPKYFVRISPAGCTG